jgi:hypothetical protein
VAVAIPIIVAVADAVVNTMLAEPKVIARAVELSETIIAALKVNPLRLMVPEDKVNPPDAVKAPPRVTVPPGALQIKPPTVLPAVVIVAVVLIEILPV